MFHKVVPAESEVRAQLAHPLRYPGSPLRPGDAEDRGLFRKQAVFLKRKREQSAEQRFSGALWEPAWQGGSVLQPGAQASAWKGLHLLAAAGLGVSQHPPRPRWRRAHGYTVPRIRLRRLQVSLGLETRAWHAGKRKIVVGQPRSRASVHPSSGKI